MTNKARDALWAQAWRCEAATGPDREIDRAIRDALGLPNDYAADWGPRGHDVPAAYPYTTSLDAAMTLVPTDCAPGVYQRDKAEWAAMVFGPDWQIIGDTRAATAPLALTAASLRALSTQEQQHDG